MPLRVSIMIPTYNQASYIGEAIASALAQDYPYLEVIVGDDASTDCTRDVVSRFKDPRLKYVRNPENLGRTGNYRNLLFNHASGDFVVNLDGDDYYTAKDFISEAVKLIEDNLNVMIVSARATTKTQDANYISQTPGNSVVPGMHLLKMLPSAQYSLMHMTSLYARQPAIECDFYRSSALSSDWESLYRLALLGNVVYIDKNVGVWRLHGMNSSQSNERFVWLDNLTIWSSIYDAGRESGLGGVTCRYLSAKCVVYYSCWLLEAVPLCGFRGQFQFFGEIFSIDKIAAILLILNKSYLRKFKVVFLEFQKLH